MEAQIESVRRSAYYHTFLIRRTGGFLDLPPTRLLVQNFVISRLDSCNSILRGLPVSSLLSFNRCKMQPRYSFSGLLRDILLLIFCGSFTSSSLINGLFSRYTSWLSSASIKLLPDNYRISYPDTYLEKVASDLRLRSD